MISNTEEYGGVSEEDEVAIKIATDIKIAPED